MKVIHDSHSSSPPLIQQQQPYNDGSQASLNTTPPGVKVHPTNAADSSEQLSDSASVTSSSTLDLGASGDDKAKKKRRSFFNFRRSKREGKKAETVL